jgi:protein-tyrosine phosphatase
MRILMVCLGNICRSPLAQGILENIIKEKELHWQVDSAGTSNWHAGESPDHRAIACAANHGINIKNQRSRQIVLSDFERFDYLLVMDKNNYRDLIQMAPSGTMHKVKLLMPYWEDRPGDEVPDPYYDDTFERSFRFAKAACESFVRKIEIETAI